MGKEENLPGGMPPAMSTFFAVRRLRLWDTGCGGSGFPEKDSQMNHNKVAATLLQDVRIRQQQDCHHFGAGNTLVHPGVQGAGT